MIWKLWLFLVQSCCIACVYVRECVYLFWLVGPERVYLFLFIVLKNGSCNKTKTFGPMPTRNGTALSMFVRMDRSFLYLSNGSAFENGKIRTQNCNWCKQERNKQANEQTNKQLFLHASINKRTPTNPPICFILARFNDVAVHIPTCYGINKNISDAKNQQKKQLPKELINKIWNVETFESDQLE